MSIVHGFSAAIIICVSTLAMLVIYKNKKLHNIQGILRFNLALSDCLCSFVFIGSAISPYYLIFKPFKFKTLVNSKQQLREIYLREINTNGLASLESFKIDSIDEIYINIFAFICYSAAFASMYLYLLASIDRLIAIKYPYKYKRSASKSKAYKFCILLWFFGFLFTLIPVLNKKTCFWFTLSFFVFYNGEFEFFLDLVYHILPLFLCWVLNILILVSIRNSKLKLKKVISTIQGGKRFRSSNLETRVTSAAKTLSIMVLVFTISFLPFNLFQLTHHYFNNYYTLVRGNFGVVSKVSSGNMFEKQYIFCIFMLYNNFWNFFIYQIRDPTFRKYTKSLLFRTKSERKVKN